MFDETGTWLWAKLGFQRARSKTFYDEKTHDFVSGAAADLEASFAIFALDVTTQYLSFELKPPEIDLESFRSALDALLRLNKREFRFTVELVPDVVQFEKWLLGVDRVSRLRIALRRPNPSFAGRPLAVRELLEKSNSARVTIEAVAPEGESLNVEGSDLKDLTTYSGEGYGDITASGQRGDRRARFESRRNLRTTEIQVTKGETAQAIARRLIESLRAMLQ